MEKRSMAVPSATMSQAEQRQHQNGGFPTFDQMAAMEHHFGSTPVQQPISQQQQQYALDETNNNNSGGFAKMEQQQQQKVNSPVKANGRHNGNAGGFASNCNSNGGNNVSPSHSVLQPVPTNSGEFLSPSLHHLFLPQHQQQQELLHSAEFGALLDGGKAAANAIMLSTGQQQQPYFGGTTQGVACTTASASSSVNAPAAPAAAHSSTRGSKSASAHSRSHDRKRPYPCTICDSRFGSKMELEEHQNSHTGMKPFQCDVCQSRFNRRSTLWNHKRIHSDAKPFKCTVCQMQFKWKNSLKCHKEMHLRKNELSQATQPDADSDADSQMLTYATAAKKTMIAFQELLGSSSGGASVALLPATGTPSRLLTCVGTPRKRAPPRSGAAKSSKHNKGRAAAERRTTTGMATAVPVQPFGATMLFPFDQGRGQEHRQQQQQKQRTKGGHSHQQEALRREQAHQQQQQQQQQQNGNGTSSLDLFRLQCGVAHLNSGHNSNNGAGSGVAHPSFFHFDSQFPLMMDASGTHLHQHQLGGTTIGGHHHQPELLACGNGTTNLHLNLEPSLLLQDFQLGAAAQNYPTATMVESQRLPTATFLGFELQQQLNSALAANPAKTEAAPNLLSNSSTSSSSASSNGASAQFGSNPGMQQTAQFVSNGANCFPGAGDSSSMPCASSTADMLLNGYQFDSASVRFLAAAAEIQQHYHHQQHSSNGNSSGIQTGAVQQQSQSQSHQQQRQMTQQHPLHHQQQEYALFCSATANGTVANEDYSHASSYGMIRHEPTRTGDQQQQQLQHFDANAGGHFAASMLGGEQHNDGHFVGLAYSTVMSGEQQPQHQLGTRGEMPQIKMEESLQQQAAEAGGGVMLAMPY